MYRPICGDRVGVPPETRCVVDAVSVPLAVRFNRVREDHSVVEPVDVGQLELRERLDEAVAVGECGCLAPANDERPNVHLEFVDDAGRETREYHLAAAFDHEAIDATVSECCDAISEVDPIATGDNHRRTGLSEGLASLSCGCIRDEQVRRRRVVEYPRVEWGTAGRVDDNPSGVAGAAVSQPLDPTGLFVEREVWIVSEDGPDPDEHGVSRRADPVHPIKVLGTRDCELFTAPGRELPVDALCGVDDDVHVRPSPGNRMAVSVGVRRVSYEETETARRPTFFCQRTEARDPMRAPTRVSAVLAALAGVLTLGVGFDVVQDWYVLEIAPWMAVVENAVPFALTGTLYYAAWWVATTDLDPSQRRAIATWTLAGVATMVTFSGWIVGVQLVQGELQPLILVVQLAAIGAVSGVIVGYRTAEVTGTRDSLAQQRSWFDAVFENTYLLTGLIRPDGTVTAINETAKASIDEPESAVVGEFLWETPWFDQSADAQATARRGVERARDGDPFRDRVRVRGAAQTRLLEIAVRPVTNDNGDVDILILEGRDITELEQRERQLRVTNRFLRHNIRNRLTLIYGNAERIARGEVTGTDATAAAEAITGAATELEVTAGTARTVNGLVQNAPDPVEVDLAETLTETVETVETAHPDASIIVDAPAATRVKILPEPGAAIEKLMTVALTACATASSPTLRIDATTGGIVTIRLDDGSLPDPEQAVLRGDLEVGPLHHADGLDVWYVYWYVELSGGVIAVENDGRTIRVQLPLADSTDLTAMEPAVAPY